MVGLVDLANKNEVNRSVHWW